MIRVGVSPEDFALAALVAAERGCPVPFGETARPDSILLVDGENRAMLFAHKDGAWWVQHVWGPPVLSSRLLYARLFYRLGMRLAARGEAQAAVRHSRQGAIALLARQVMAVTDGGEYYERRADLGMADLRQRWSLAQLEGD